MTMRGRTSIVRLCAFLMKYVSIFSVTSKSAMTPSFIGLMATMLPGVRPSMSFASFPTASTRPFTLLIATIEGSLTTIPLPRAYTHVFAVPRSIARSLENNESIERRLKPTLQSRRRRQSAVGSPFTDQSCCQSVQPGAAVTGVAAEGRDVDINGVLYVFGRSDGGHNTVLAGFFDLIHRFVGRLHELFRRCGHIGERRHADRRGEVDVEAVRLQEPVLDRK